MKGHQPWPSWRYLMDDIDLTYWNLNQYGQRHVDTFQYLENADSRCIRVAANPYNLAVPKWEDLDLRWKWLFAQPYYKQGDLEVPYTSERSVGLTPFEVAC